MGRRVIKTTAKAGALAQDALFGGASLGSKRYIWWNFVSSSKERIEQAKEEWKTRRFDIVRNWALVRALLSDPYMEVEYLFCSRSLKSYLLAHAQRIGEDPALIERAEELLHQPGDSLPHDDHLHLRIYCAADDRAYGCVDRGPARWWKKRWKYLPPRAADLAGELVELMLRAAQPFRGLRGFVR